MSNLETFLYMILIFLVFIVIGLAFVFFVIRNKEKNKKMEETEKEEATTSSIPSTIKVAKEYDKKSIFDFLEFDTVKDNMIIQKNGKVFLMAIECKGVNYDLMSEVEKASTEQGFSNFLNTLREPIQIYIQTRTVNLEKNIISYREKVNKIKDRISLKEFKLKEYLGRENQSEKVLKEKQFELLREKNLYSYGVDIVTDTQRMSLNKNVLKKKYYIIIRYYYDTSDQVEVGLLSPEEMRETAFSNLYTRAASIISVLSGIGIVAKPLNSFELVDLLYNAYNRDDSEIFGIDKAIEAGYDEIYVDSQNIIDKKILALNNEIQIRAKEEANKIINKVKDEREKELDEIEDNLDDIIMNLAKQMINDEKTNIPKDIKEEAIKRIENETKEKGEKEANGKQTKESNKKRRAS